MFTILRPVGCALTATLGLAALMTAGCARTPPDPCPAGGTRVLRSIWVNDPAVPGQPRRRDAPRGTYFLAFFPKDALRGSYRAVDAPDYRLVTDSGELRDAVSNSLGRVWSCTDSGDAPPSNGEGTFARPGTVTTYSTGEDVQKLTLLFLVPDAMTTGRIIRLVGGTDRQEVTTFNVPVR